jgi:ferredoxin-NADP reductase
VGSSALTSPGKRVPLTVRVTEARREADAVRSLVLRRTSGAALPPWEAGAHIDLLLPDGGARQYSLCGNPTDLSSYRIAVLREQEGRGCSRWVHDSLGVGDLVRIRPPRNHFVLEAAPAYAFIAGGVGITPILPMVKAVAGRGEARWRLIYRGRSRSSMAFLGELEALGDGVEIVAGDVSCRPDLPALMNQLPDQGLVYVCGPAGFVDAVRAAAAAAGLTERVRYELFGVPVSEDSSADFGPPFQVELRRSGLVLDVSSTSTILETVRAAKINVITDCEDGICGSCETAILEGCADHRDHVLTPDEQRENTSMMICVSRSADGRMVLDL